MSDTVRIIELNPDADTASLDEALGQLLHQSVTVRLGDTLQLTQAGDALRCDVIDDANAIHRCAFEYEVMVENARRAFEASSLARRLPDTPRRWRVVIPQARQLVPVWPLPASELDA